MAPAKFDYRSQIIDNCEFFVAKYDIVTVITVRDPKGLYTAHAIRSNQDSREALLSSDPSDVVLKAISSLHAKSSEAAHHYITTNGFSHPPDVKRTRFDEDERDEDNDNDNDNDDAASFVSGHSASSTAALSYWGSSDDEAAMTPASSADPHAGCHRETSRSIEKGINNNTSRRRSSKPPAAGGHKQAREPVTRFPTDPYDSDDEHHHQQQQPHYQHQHQQLPPHVRLLSPVRSSSAANISTSYRPPPPPPGWTGPPMPPPPPPVRAIPIPTPQSQQQQPGPRYYPHHPPPGQPMPPPLPQPKMGSTGPNHNTTPNSEVPPHFVGPMRINGNNNTNTALHYKASAPALNSSHRHSTSSLATTITQQPSPNPVHHHHHNNYPPPPQPPPLSLPQPPAQQQQQRLYDVRLTIRFGRGEQRILESSRPSVRALQEIATAYVRTHAAAFGGASSPTFNPADGPTTSGELRARVRNAFFGPAEAYDMSAYRGDDLTRLFGALGAGGSGIPRFEIEVEEVQGQGQQGFD
ncbi:hypothetical protein Hte_011203 [Hypoxylon texense]